VPRSAARTSPGRSSSAPEKAPFLCPKSSPSTSPGAIAPQFTATRGTVRPESPTARAASSLPVPVSPAILTATCDRAIGASRAYASARSGTVVARPGVSEAPRAQALARPPRARVLSEQEVLMAGLDEVPVGERRLRDPGTVDRRSVLGAEILDDPSPEDEREARVAGREARIGEPDDQPPGRRRRDVRRSGAADLELAEAGERDAEERREGPVARQREVKAGDRGRTVLARVVTRGDGPRLVVPGHPSRYARGAPSGPRPRAARAPAGSGSRGRLRRRDLEPSVAECAGQRDGSSFRISMFSMIGS
jgi:hypothetical protein